jgi:hypothetical protein
MIQYPQGRAFKQYAREHVARRTGIPAAEAREGRAG